MKRLFLHEVLSAKGKRQWPQLHVDSPTEAAAAVEAELQHQRVKALRMFVHDMECGAYPDNGHTVRMDDAVFTEFLSLAERSRSRAS